MTLFKIKQLINISLDFYDIFRFPIKPKRRLKRAETKDSDILSVGVRDGKD